MSLCSSNYALRHDSVWGSGCIYPCFLGLATRLRWVVSFTPLPFYPRGKSSRHSLDRKVGGPQSRPGRYDEEKFLTPLGLELRTLGHPSCRLPLYRRRYPACCFTASRPALGPNQPPIQQINWHFPWGKALEEWSWPQTSI
jgi:hypothetical protein